MRLIEETWHIINTSELLEVVKELVLNSDQGPESSSNRFSQQVAEDKKLHALCLFAKGSIVGQCEQTDKAVNRRWPSIGPPWL